jgi:ankyrin repeat protein
MPYLPARPDLEQLRHQAKDLLRAADGGDRDSLARIREVSDRIMLASAQLALAREYGFASWPKLKTEVDRREVLNSRDLSKLTKLLDEQPELATTKMRNWCDHKQAGPVAYMAMLRFDHNRLGLPRELPGTGAVAKALIDAGSPVDGYRDDTETPLITAASYGDADVARVLIDAGADLEARAAPNAGGAPGRTALQHAAVFGMTDVIDVLVKAGATVDSLETAAAAGDVGAWPLERSTLQSRIRALVFAADHQRLDVIDRLIGASTPVDAADAEWGRQALRTAANHGRPASVRRLLEHGADPNLRDEDGFTALDLCQPERRYLDGPGHDEVDAILRRITRGSQGGPR